ncbi:hypothetical protein V2175_09855 [Bacillus licheniformis]
MANEFEHMRLDRQLCFLLYASSREMTKLYKPLLDELNITYPQYLALLLLWEHGELSVKTMGKAPLSRFRHTDADAEENGAARAFNKRAVT